MDKFDRIYRLHHILSGRRTPITFQDLRERLGCSKATAYRLIHALEHYLGAPIERDEELGGLRYRSDPGGRVGRAGGRPLRRKSAVARGARAARGLK